MKNKNGLKVAFIVVLAVASLVSTVGVTAMSVPHRKPARTTLLDVCGDSSTNRFAQYLAAIEWAEVGGPVPDALAASCSVDLDPEVSFAGYGGESWARFEQYMAAIEGDLVSEVSFTGYGDESGARFEQYMAAIEGRLGRPPVTRVDQVNAAIEWAETGGPVPGILLVGELSPEARFEGYGGESWARFEQYMAAIER